MINFANFHYDFKKWEKALNKAEKNNDLPKKMAILQIIANSLKISAEAINNQAENLNKAILREVDKEMSGGIKSL